jgi:hypothetical protein
MSGGWWWKPAEEEDDGAAAAVRSLPVLSGEFQALQMSTIVSALAHLVAGGDDDNPAAMGGGGVHAPRGRSHYSPAASAPTPDQFAPAGEHQARIIVLIFSSEIVTLLLIITLYYVV